MSSEPHITIEMLVEPMFTKVRPSLITKLMMVRSYLIRCGLEQHVSGKDVYIKFTREGAAIAYAYLSKSYVEGSHFSDLIRGAKE